RRVERGTDPQAAALEDRVEPVRRLRGGGEGESKQHGSEQRGEFHGGKPGELARGTQRRKRVKKRPHCVPPPATYARRSHAPGTAMIRAACRLVLLCLVIAPVAATAQSGFPNHPVKFVVPFPGGGINDVLARIIGDKLQTKWGQPIVVENR